MRLFAAVRTPLVLYLLWPAVASAGWGEENWGEMMWGGATVPVPSLSPEGLLLVVLLVVIVPTVLLAGRRKSALRRRR